MACILGIWIMRSLWNSLAKIVIQRKLNIGVSSRADSELETKTWKSSDHLGWGGVGG